MVGKYYPVQVLRGESCCGAFCVGVGMCMAVRSSVEGVLAELADPRRGAALAAAARPSANSLETAQMCVKISIIA